MIWYYLIHREQKVKHSQRIHSGMSCCSLKLGRINGWEDFKGNQQIYKVSEKKHSMKKYEPPDGTEHTKKTRNSWIVRARCKRNKTVTHSNELNSAVYLALIAVAWSGNKRPPLLVPAVRITWRPRCLPKIRWMYVGN